MTRRPVSRGASGGWSSAGEAEPTCCSVCGTEERVILVTSAGTRTPICLSCAQAGAAPTLRAVLGFYERLAPFRRVSRSAGVSAPDLHVCERCGTTWDEVAETGMVGCAACYETFGDALRSLVEAVQRL